MNQTKTYITNNNEGFSLVELLIAMAISACVLTAVYSSYVTSDRVYTAQNQVVQAQQDARIALDIMGRDIRMAGFIASGDREGGDFEINTDVGGQAWSDGTGDAIEEATATAITFELDADNIAVQDLDADGTNDAGRTETVRYAYDNVTNELTMQQWQWVQGAGTWQEWDDGAGNPLGAQVMITNVTACQFDYFDADGNPLAAPLSADDRRNNLRTVAVTITVRTARPDPLYANPDGVNGGHRTRTLTSRFEARNLGL